MNHTPQATVAPRKALRASFTHRTDTSWHSMQQVQGEGWRLRQSLAPWSPHPRQLVEPKRKKWPNNSMQHINLLHHLRNNNILTMFNCPLPTSPGSYDLLRVATQLVASSNQVTSHGNLYFTRMATAPMIVHPALWCTWETSGASLVQFLGLPNWPQCKKQITSTTLCSEHLRHESTKKIHTVT